MNLRLLRLSFLCVLSTLTIALSTPSADAQVGSTGDTTATPVAGVGHSYIQNLNETVDPKDGSLSIMISAPIPQERGVNLPIYPFLYTSNSQPTPTPSWTSGQASNGEMYVTSVALATPQNSGPRNSVTQITNYINTYIAGQPASCTLYNNFVYTDPSGGRHSLGIQGTNNQAQLGCTGMGLSASPEGTIVGDAQYTAIATNTGNFVRVYDLRGNELATNEDTQPGSNSSVEDANGNYLRPSGRSYTQSNGATKVPGLGGPYQLSYSTPFSSAFTFGSRGTTYAYPFNVYALPSNGTECTKTFSGTAGGYSGTYYETLPNSQQYIFTVDPTFGLINHITYPTGATVDYAWATNPQSQVLLGRQTSPTPFESCDYIYDWPAIQSRILTVNGTKTQEQDYTYAPTVWSGATWTKKTTTVTTTDYITTGHPSFKTVYTFANHDVSPSTPDTIATYDTAGNLLTTSYKIWGLTNQLAAECTTINGAGVTNGIFYKYSGLANLQTDKAEYDYGLVTSACTQPSSTPTRETKTAYQTFSSAPMIKNQPQTLQVYGSGVLIAETDYSYDEYNLYPLVDVPQILGHDETYYSTSSSRARGNATTVRQKCFILSGGTCPDVVTHAQYDKSGQVVAAWDGNANETQFSYADNYTTDDGSPPSSGVTNTYVTQITRPSTNGVAHISHFQYEFNGGKLRKELDENSQTTTYCYWTNGCSGTTLDSWLRLTQTILPDGGGTTTNYTDSSPNAVVTSTTVAMPDPSIVSQTTYDSLGRVTSTVATSAGNIETDTKYDGFGQIASVSNPYISTGDRTYGLTLYQYDSLGRKTIQAQPDGTSVLQWCYNGVRSSGQKNCTSRVGSKTNTTWIDVSDEAGNHSQNDFDGLGRLVAVLEPNATNVPALETDYQYNVLDNLTQTDQWGGAVGTAGNRQRLSVYDSLSRLVAVSNPESGVTCYGTISASYPTLANCTEAYDGNGNLRYKTDARGGTTTYSYDVLNRVTRKAYSDGTLSSVFGYDGNNDSGTPLSSLGITSLNAIGRLSLNDNSSNAGTAYSYDAIGRIAQETHYIPGKPGWNTTVSALHDLAGNTTNLTYPDGRVVQTGFDAAGRVNLVKYSNWNGSTTNLPQTYFSESNGYDPAGHLTAATFGNVVPYSAAYDNRERVNNMTYGPSTSPAWSQQLAWTANNNLQSETNLITGVQRQFAYDNLNRLTSAQDIYSNLAVPSGSNGQTGSTSTSGSGAQETPGVTGAVPLWTDPNDSNLLINADAPGTAGWGVASATISDGVAAPDGTLSASTFTGNAGSTDTYLADSASSASLFDGETVTGSVWLRSPAGSQTVNLYFVESGSAGYDVPAYKQVALTSSWQQYQLSGQFHYGHQTMLLQIGGGGSIGAGQSVSLWGAMLEDTGTSSPTITNFLPFSQRVTATSWSLNALATDNATQAPDGTSTAASVTGTSADSYIIDTVNNPAPYTGQTITASVWLRAPSGSQRLLLTLIEDGNTPVGGVYVNLTGAWQRFQVSGTNSHTLNELALQIGGGSTWSNGQVVQVWGAQMEFASTAGPYVATAGVPEGKEANLTNILPYSQQLSGSSWGTSGVILANNALAAPDGSMTGAQMTGPQGATDAYMTNDVPNPSLYDAATVTGSVFLRCPSGTKTLGLYLAAENASGRTYLGSNTITLTTTWQRFTYTGQLPNGLTRLFLQIGGSSTFQAGQVVDVWGTQVELASHAGPYVTTTALPVTTGSEPVNILPVSQVLNGPSWGVANGTATPNVAGAPDGTSTAATVTAASSSADTFAINSVPNPSLYDGQTVTASIYLRVASGTLNTNLFLVNVGTNGWSVPAQIPVAITTSWQRFAVTGTNQNGLSQLSLQIGGAGTVTAGQSFQLWGAQMVLGSDPAPYTPTSSSTTVYATGQAGTLVQNGLNQSYSYDSFGNILQNGSFESSYTANNQMVGFAYDAAGNVLSDGMNIMTWDAESRMKSVGGATYIYDGEGTRVETQSSTVTDTVYFGGEPIARYSGGQWTDLIYGPTGLFVEVPGTATGAPVYRVTDNLGTNVGSLLANGTFISPVDHTPFGQVFTGNTSDPYLFTGKERDVESGLDNLGARYYGSNMGRFMSPDDGSDQDPSDPQSWNIYEYVRNNPLRFTDPDGHGCQTATTTASFAGGPITSTTTSDFSSCFDGTNWSAIGSAFRKATDIGSQALHQVANIIKTPGGAGCLASTIGAGAGAGAVAGGEVGLVGFAGGPTGLLTTSGGAGIGAVGGGASGLLVGMIACPGGAANGGGGGRASGSSARLTRGQQRQTAEHLGMKEVKGVTSQGQPVFEKGGRYFSFSNTSHNIGPDGAREVFKEVDRSGFRMYTTDINLNRIAP